MKRESDKWAFIDDDSDLDEEGEAARREAKEIRQQANSLAAFADGLPEGGPRHEKLRGALAMYRRAETCVSRAAGSRKLSQEDRQLVLQCKLNGACLALRVGDEARAEELCDGALALDPENPHAALFHARLASCRSKSPLADIWARRAQAWGEKRGEQGLLEQAAQFLTGAEPSDAVDGKLRPVGASGLADWIMEGVENVRQKQPERAQPLLERAVTWLDKPEQGGPIEQLEGRGQRALAFNALESLAEAHAQLENWSAAMDHGQRAVAIIEDAGSRGAPFTEPEVHRREGLLCLSMGHVTAVSGGDPAPTFRRAARALAEHGGDPAEEGQALLQLGLAVVARVAPALRGGGGGPLDTDELEETCQALDGAADRFQRARSRKAGDAAGGGEVRRWDLARKQLQAHTALVSFLADLGERSHAERYLEASKHLLSHLPESAPSALLGSWAELCGKWGVAAMKVGQLPEAEEALMHDQRFAKVASSLDVELEAWKSLAVVRRRRGDERGVEEAMSRVESLVPAAERAETVQTLWKSLQSVGPVLEASATEEASTAAAGIGERFDARGREIDFVPKATTRASRPRDFLVAAVVVVVVACAAQVLVGNKPW